MNKAIQACIALAALVAVFLVPSVALASPELTSPTGTKAPVGTRIQLTNAAHAATTKQVFITTSPDIIECEKITMTGEVSSNTGTDIAINILTVEFRGPIGSPCPSATLGNFTITPSHTSNPIPHNGINSLPWCLTVNGLEDFVSIRGGTCSEAPRPLTFSIHSPSWGTCYYEKASLTAIYTTHPAPTILTVANQAISKHTGSVFCTSTVRFDFALTLETDTEAPQDVYIK
jgi:hypothetical protein